MFTVRRTAAACLSLFLLGAACGSPSHGTLSLGGNPTSDCRYGSKSITWRDVQDQETEFGGDALVLSTGGSARIDRVELTDVTGEISLVHALLVPFGGAPNAFRWGSPDMASAPGWALRQDVPSEIRNVAPTSPSLPDDARRTWQLVLGVRAGKSGGSGVAKISYTVGGSKHTLTGNQRVAVVPSEGLCPNK